MSVSNEKVKQPGSNALPRWPGLRRETSSSWPVATPGEMLIPFRPDRRRIEIALATTRAIRPAAPRPSRAIGRAVRPAVGRRAGHGRRYRFTDAATEYTCDPAHVPLCPHAHANTTDSHHAAGSSQQATWSDFCKNIGWQRLPHSLTSWGTPGTTTGAIPATARSMAEIGITSPGLGQRYRVRSLILRGNQVQSRKIAPVACSISSN